MKQLFFISLLYSTLVNAQNPAQGYEDYKAISNDAKTVSFFDDFIDNANQWDLTVESNYSVHKIENEVYYLQSKDNESYDTYGRYNTQRLAINDSANFEIEALIKLASGGEFAEYGLLWGRSLCCEHNFNVSADAMFSVGEFKFGWDYLISPTYSKHIYRRDGYNRLTVRKIGKDMYFFINKNLVASMPARPFFGDKFGFWVSNGAAIKIDYFRINYLPDTIIPIAETPVIASVTAIPMPAFTSFAVNQAPKPTFVQTAVASPPIPTPYQVRPIPTQLEGRKILSGKETIVSDNEITLQIWDDGEEDGDIISIYFNGNWLLQDHLLTKKIKQLPIALDTNGDNYLILYINNEGSRPTNTVALSIDDGIRKRRLLLSADQRSCQSVRLVPPK